MVTQHPSGADEPLSPIEPTTQQATIQSPPDGLSLAEVLLYAPLGLAIQLGTKLPTLVADGQAEYKKQATVARFLGRALIEQQKRKRRVAATQAVLKTAPAKASDPSNQVLNPELVQPRQSAGEVGDAGDPTPTTLDSTELPISGYDTLPARSLLGLLDSLNMTDLQAVSAYESSHRQRATVLNRVEQLIADASTSAAS